MCLLFYEKRTALRLLKIKKSSNRIMVNRNRVANKNREGEIKCQS